jgi:hypothetical protein
VNEMKTGVNAIGQVNVLQSGPPTWGQVGSNAASGSIKGDKDVGGKLVQSVVKVEPDIIQQRAAPGYKLILYGTALRVGYPIPTPMLDKVDGMTPTPGRQTAKQWTHAIMNDVPVYGLQWHLEYHLPKAPSGKIAMPANPMLNVGG